MSLRSPLGRALGRGSAKEGVSHWWTQRLTAAALVVLGLWFLASLLALHSLDYFAVRAWLAQPITAVVALLLLPTLLWHSHLGVQVVIEDYVHHEPLKLLLLVLSRFAHSLLAVAALVAVARIVFAAAQPAGLVAGP